MEWWGAELLRALVLLGGGVVVQQLIRRHGVDYVAHIFKATPQAGRAFLALADIAYYLIVFAYTLLNVNLDPSGPLLWRFEEVLISIAGLALIIGGLHAFNLLALPAVGRSLARRNGDDVRTVKRKAAPA